MGRARHRRCSVRINPDAGCLETAQAYLRQVRKPVRLFGRHYPERTDRFAEL